MSFSLCNKNSIEQCTPLTLASGPLKVDWLGWLKYCRLLLEYLRKVSAVLLAKVQAFKKASFCSWCLLMSCVIKVTRSISFVVRCFWIISSSRRYSRSRLSRTEQTWKKKGIVNHVRMIWEPFKFTRLLVISKQKQKIYSVFNEIPVTDAPKTQ